MRETPEGHNNTETEKPLSSIETTITDNDIEKAEDYIEGMEKVFGQMGLDEENAYFSKVVFGEMVKNAIVHGNLRLHKRPEDDHDTFKQKIIDTAKLPENQNKLVKILIENFQDRLQMRIEDSGGKPGPELFDKLNRLLHTEPTTDTLENTGRGIIYARHFFGEDNVKFEPGEHGLRVTLTKPKS